MPNAYTEETIQFQAWKLARMNLAIHGIDANRGARNTDSFRANLYPDLNADLMPVRKDLANLPFNMSDWGGENLQQDVRRKFGMPTEKDVNCAWVQHFMHYLSPVGVAGFVFAKTTSSELSCSTQITEDARKCVAEEEAPKEFVERARRFARKCDKENRAFQKL